MSVKKRGRKPTGNKRRDSEVIFNLTPEDSDWLERTAKMLGFNSRGAFLTAIVERLVVARMAPIAWLKVGWQVYKLSQRSGAAEYAGLWNPFRERILPLEPGEPPRPPTAMPEEELASAETKRLLATIRQELHAK